MIFDGSSKVEWDAERDIVFGNYDRIQVMPINSLAEFTKASNQANAVYYLTFV